MNVHGSTLSFPITADVRGAVATTANRSEQIAQAIADVLETRKGERVMMPDYGISDWIFAAQDFGFVARLAYELETQILRYVPLVKSVSVKSATDDDGRAAVAIRYAEVSEINAPKNLVFPIWKYVGGEA